MSWNGKRWTGGKYIVSLLINSGQTVDTIYWVTRYIYYLLSIYNYKQKTLSQCRRRKGFSDLTSDRVEYRSIYYTGV